MIPYSEILQKIKAYIQSFYTHDSASYCYHGVDHTARVVEAVQEMSRHYNLPEEEDFIVTSAAYFHDLGYVNGGSQEHESRSAVFAEEFLSKENVSAAVIQRVKSCILATKMPQSPSNLVESILCDADLFHLGTADFKEKSKLIHQEIEATHKQKIGKGLWRSMTIKLLEEHNYHTDYAKNKLEEKKKENLQNLLQEDKKAKDKNSEAKKPGRGIETMFRITSSNNQRLSDMADNKANILLTVNSIILSLVVTVLLRRLDNETHLLIPTILLMVSVVLTMIFAILATIPKIPNGHFDVQNVERRKVNLLFFGNFYKSSFSDYEEGMNRTMKNSDLLYGMLTKDVYSQGVSLGRKYVLLRYAYTIFMIGLVVSVFAFSIAVVLGK
ncbi:putative metal-dependent HD superfamily phosphohydrolase [Sphingobacterium alimentarium]|uniref:Putative metal-dependent HD superfamily phosphohydrolase n=1 Tax=Sphingobacterium alimentarium TaxID=797292 RepID=A0A4R3VUN8_9SPHI|nr:Pycsar system effector family protein [Sphingobacterium alimentarium]TCV18645.1 putative metal-dependent HD superfamily phosphohydrolase [Sphingobacterium alimentarium]